MRKNSTLLVLYMYVLIAFVHHLAGSEKRTQKPEAERHHLAAWSRADGSLSNEPADRLKNVAGSSKHRTQYNNMCKSVFNAAVHSSSSMQLPKSPNHHLGDDLVIWELWAGRALRSISTGSEIQPRWPETCSQELQEEVWGKGLLHLRS